MIRYTLIADGSSDKTLLNIIKWLLDDLYPKIPNKGTFADFRPHQSPPQNKDIKSRVRFATDYFPFDILFYHRDAESNTKTIIEERLQEIQSQLPAHNISNTVCLIPIKMMEAWLLFDKNAIKKAAGNRNYKAEIKLPTLKQVENINPKVVLHDLLKQVSGLKGRQLKNFNVHQAVHLVAQNIENFNVLRQLPAFRKFETELKHKVENFLNNKP